MLAEGSRLVTLEKYSFSDQAARLATAERPDVQLQYVDDAETLFRLIHEEQNTVGLVPFENSSDPDGVVRKHLQMLHKLHVNIRGEVAIDVEMCVGGIRGTTLENITDVLSHPKALGQCSHWIDGLPSEVNRHQTKTTVHAARTVAEDGKIGSVALSSLDAIQAYDLSLLDRDVANLNDGRNVTQFFVVEKNGIENHANDESIHHAAIIQPRNMHPGVLCDILGIIKTARVDLTSLHSGEFTREGETQFFLEMDSENTRPELFSIMRRKLEDCAAVQSVQWLGSWNERVYSSKIKSTDEPFRGSRPVVAGEHLDMDKRYHRLHFQPINRQGVLFDVLHPIGISGVSLEYIRSVNEGLKRYSFIANIDTGSTTRSRAEILMEELQKSPNLQRIEWQGSYDNMADIPVDIALTR